MSAEAPATTAVAVARPLDAIGAAVALILCLTWGFNQVAIKIALADIPPLTQAALRSGCATVLVLAWMRLRGMPILARDGTLVPGVVAGLLFGLEFIMIYPGLVYTTASRAVVFVYFAPIFVALGARWFLPGDHLGAVQWTGLLLAFAGLAVAFGVPTPAADPRQLIGDIMMVIAAAAWAATTLVIKGSSLNRVSAEKTLLYQLAVSAPLCAFGALLLGERMTHVPSALSISLVAYQTVWVVGVTFVVWFAMILRYSASRLSAFTFLTPLFGVAAGHLVLGDPVTPAFAVAVAMVAGGLILVNRSR
jgi:drug/metabolite transporter (DMT)-like permease